MYIFGCSFDSVKDIVGYDPKDLMADGVAITDFIHPADQVMMMHRPRVESSKYIIITTIVTKPVSLRACLSTYGGGEKACCTL